MKETKRKTKVREKAAKTTGKATAKVAKTETKTRSRGRSIVIVESPAKAKTINKILGRDFLVKACMGHVRDLPSSTLGINIEDNFAPTYRTIKGKSAIVRELRDAAQHAPAVYLASDPDREGEAIAWHLVQALKVPEDKVRRVTFNELTPRAITEAFKHPTVISQDRVNAQQARRLLDRIVGYKLSPLLWSKVGRGLSAGRVQSVAVKLLVDREREIQAFKAEEFWEIAARLTKISEPSEFTAKLEKVDGKDVAIKNTEEARSLVDGLKPAPFRVTKVSQKQKREDPPPPFTTSLLQQQASVLLRFTTRKTMRVAQQLYEGIEVGEEGSVGLITYMRTDSFRIAEEAIQECGEFIRREYGEKYHQPGGRRYRSRKGAQEAHESIRPTSVRRNPEDIRGYLTPEQYKLYRLIWLRFVASQMTAADYQMTEAEIHANAALFVAKGREMKFDGYTRVSGHRLKKDEQILPALTEGETLNLLELQPSQHFTQPPPRYTEATLVKALEKNGIGRPSTYAPIISTIQDRGYVRVDNRALIPTELGILVTDKLTEYFDDVVDTQFTARMEEELDDVEESKREWVSVLREFYEVFAKDLEKAKDEMTSAKEVSPEEAGVCEKCGKPMAMRWARFGKFLGCTGFPECKTTRSLTPPEETGETCAICQAAMVIKSGRNGRFLACSRYPDCRHTRPLARGGRRVNIPPDFDLRCDKCGSKMAVRYGRRGGFLACPGYPQCKNTRSFPKEWIAQEKQTAPTESAPAPDESEILESE